MKHYSSHIRVYQAVTLSAIKSIRVNEYHIEFDGVEDLKP